MRKSVHAAPKAAGKTNGKTIADFRAAHDKSFIVPKKIEMAIKALGNEGWEYEVTFLKLAGLSTTDLAMYRENFEDYVVVVNGKNPKRLWAGSIQLAKKMRELL